MISRSPLEVPVGRKLSREEMLEALRISIIAELDAINLYMQFARAVADKRVRRVFEDVAKEEKTHVGEFLALLKQLDSEQAAELLAGEKEVKELMGES
ncbi:MAG: rubrerythrin [Thermoprotei archaeon]|nr:MAG: rubrerythrin [Thermoprotei archaeon]